MSCRSFLIPRIYLKLADLCEKYEFLKIENPGLKDKERAIFLLIRLYSATEITTTISLEFLLNLTLIIKDTSEVDLLKSHSYVALFFIASSISANFKDRSNFLIFSTKD